jgi:hypothetical protein
MDAIPKGSDNGPASFEITWEDSSFRDTEYGWVGAIKAFSIVQKGEKHYALYPRLPDRKGMVHQTAKCPSQEDARQRAAGILGEFLADFFARDRAAGSRK